MASAASLPRRSRRPGAPAGKRGSSAELLAMAGLFVYIAVAVAHYPVFGLWSSTWAALTAAVLLAALWSAHLAGGGLPRGWCVAMGAPLAWFLGKTWIGGWGSWQRALASLGCGLFVYAMVWVFAAHEREPGLQPLATAALVLSMGVLAKPAVVAACACISLAVFVDERRRVGGWWRSTLLVLTPVMLCAVLLGMLNKLWAGNLVGELWGTNPTPTGAVDGTFRLWPAGPQSLWFALAALASRAVQRRTGITDAAYLFLVVFAGTIGTAEWMPHRLGAADVRTVVAAGACSLMAIAPPRSSLARVLSVAGMSMAAVFAQ